MDRCKYQSHTPAKCISRRCYYCDLEDMLVALKKVDVGMVRL